jgi:sugar lactone lactonase YvrE
MKTYFSFRTLVILLLVFISLLLPTGSIQSTSTRQSDDLDYVYYNSWGGDGRQLLGPVDVVVSGENKVFISNSDFDRVSIIDQTGVISSEIGSYGADPGEFYRPFGLLKSSSGDLVVADGWNRRLQVFDSTGTFKSIPVSWDMNTMNTPLYLAEDSLGNIALFMKLDEYYFETRTGFYGFAVIFYDSLYQQQSILRLEDESYDFNNVNDMAFDQNDRLWLGLRSRYSDPEENIDPSFIIIDDFPNITPVYVKDENQIIKNISVYGMEFNATGKMIISSEHNLMEIQFDGETLEGTVLSRFGDSIESFYKGLSISTDGTIYAADFACNRIRVFDVNKDWVTDYGSPETPHGFFHYPSNVRVFDNEIYVADGGNGRIEIFDQDGTFLRTFPEGDLYAEFDWNNFTPMDMLKDSAGNLFVLEQNPSSITKFSPDGSFITTDVKPGMNWRPGQIALDNNGNVYVPGPFVENPYSPTEDVHEEVCVLNNDLSLQDCWSYDNDLEKTYYLWNITSDYEDNLLVPVLVEQGLPEEPWLYEVWKFSPEGEKLATLTLPAQTPDGRTYFPIALTTAADGNIFALYKGGNVIRQYDPTLTNVLTQFGEWNETATYWDLGDYQFLATGDDGSVYASSGSTHKISKFITAPLPPDSFSGLIQNGEFLNYAIEGLQSPTALWLNFSGSLPYWTRGGQRPVTIVESTIPGEGNSLQLGEVVNPPSDQDINSAWTYQSLYIPAGLSSARLSFDYSVEAIDPSGKASFIVSLYDEFGTRLLEQIVVVDQPIQNLNSEEWVSVEFEASMYQGSSVRLLFSAQNNYPDSQGIKVYIQNVRMETDWSLYLPMIKR